MCDSLVTDKLLNISSSFPLSSSPLHPACQDEKKGDSSSRRQLGAAQMHGQWKSSTWNCVAEGRQTPDGAGGRRGPSEEVDSESEEPNARAEWQIHLQGLESGWGDQRHV